MNHAELENGLDLDATGARSVMAPSTTAPALLGQYPPDA